MVPVALTTCEGEAMMDWLGLEGVASCLYVVCVLIDRPLFATDRCLSILILIMAQPTHGNYHA